MIEQYNLHEPLIVIFCCPLMSKLPFFCARIVNMLTIWKTETPILLTVKIALKAHR